MLKIRNIEEGGTVAILVFLLGCVGLVSVIALDKLYWRTGVLAEGWPDLSLGHSMRSAMIFISVSAICWSLSSGKKPQLVLGESNGATPERLGILGALSVSAIFLLLFIFEPATFSNLSHEGGPIECGSALLLLGGCLVFVISFTKSRNVSSDPRATRLSLVFLSLVLFVVAMEEISWLQRVLRFETPRALGRNVQDEMSFHNLPHVATCAENLYYFGAFLFLVVLPFIRLLYPSLLNSRYLRTLMARPFIGVIGSIACAYNFDMWNIAFTQVAFFGSLVILFVFAMLSSSRSERGILGFAIVLLAATQALFLLNGMNFARLWEVTEYKEFLIPLALFAYSLDVFTGVNEMGGYPYQGSEQVDGDG